MKSNFNHNVDDFTTINYRNTITDILLSDSFQDTFQDTTEMNILISDQNMLEQLIGSKLLDFLISHRTKKNTRIRMLTPFSKDKKNFFHKIAPFVQYQIIESFEYKFSYLILDNLYLCIFGWNNVTDQLDIFTYNNNEPHILLTNFSFNTIWKQVEHFDMMIREKKHSEMLVDLITHDIGNHHQIVSSSMELIELYLNKFDNSSQETRPIIEKLQHYCKLAQDAISRSQCLVESIRRLEKMYREKNVKLKDIDILEVIQKALWIGKYSAHLLNKEINLTIDNKTEQQIIKVAGDDLFEEIFINFFSNSLRYTNESEAKIEIVISEMSLGKGYYYMITISDYGIGIDDNRKKEIFQRFYTFSRGSGLGLSLIRALVERYNGRIWVGDRVYKDHTKGTKFGMLLPALK